MQTNNLQYAPIGMLPVVHVSQFDVGRQFKFNIYDGSIAYSMPSGTTARIDGIKPDKHGFSYTDAVSVSGNVATVTTKQQMTVLAGTVKCEIRFISNGTNIGTINFILEVEESPINGDTNISETEIPAIIEIATEHMLEAEAWARGTKDGVAVGSDEEQYHNNSKYYSEQSADSATVSANSADASQSSAEDSEAWAVGERNGAAVGNTDETYQNNSKYYSEQSSDSADASQESAEDSEAWAIGERNGTAVTSTDETYENNSKYYSQRSGTYATNASNSAAAALLSEQNAKASEDILAYYTTFVIPRFIIQNNRLYMSDAATGEFTVANNRLYIKNAS